MQPIAVLKSFNKAYLFSSYFFKSCIFLFPNQYCQLQSAKSHFFNTPNGSKYQILNECVNVLLGDTQMPDNIMTYPKRKKRK